MEWRTGDMLDVGQKEGCNVIAFTANAVVREERRQAALVMGGGAALRVRNAFPGIDFALGQRILNASSRPSFKSGVQDDYYVVAAKQNDLWVAAVQVKRHWQDVGDWDLTEDSLEALSRHLAKYPDLKCVLNCPLIGLGGFADRADEVKEMVSLVLKDANVLVCVM
jgi:hypothetical protein